nr:hypothetical protein [Tanacetum cinerariifolium]
GPARRGTGPRRAACTRRGPGRCSGWPRSRPGPASPNARARPRTGPAATLGNHRIIGGQHAADGQAVAVVGVGHEGAGHRHG